MITIKQFIITLTSVTAGLTCLAAEPKPTQPEPTPLRDHYNREAGQQLIDQGIHKVVFVKRKTLNANHFYTEHVNSKWRPGGNLCVLDLKTGAVRELVPELTGGVFNRFDISFDAKRIVFDYKKNNDTGYFLYEVNVDGTGLRRLTFPQENETELVKKYGDKRYHHGTDDMHPCYLPDGGIAFVSTRCQYSIICNPKDIFTTTVLYRMDRNGKNMRQLSNSTVSEASPVMMPDGRILYHRWEYNDKAAGNVKCLWAMRPDGTGSVEIYGNTLTQPETLIYGRPVPGNSNKMVSLACSHCGQNNAMGTIITIDTSKDTRTREPITYITTDVDARQHNGFNFKVNGKWIFDRTGKPGRLFKDPYPVSEQLFLVSHKPKGYAWNDPNAYDLYLLDEEGGTVPLYQSRTMSCWHPFPLIQRETPPDSKSGLKPELAAKNKAECIVTDVYVGLNGVKRGTIKYLRILEQVPRPWAARNRWQGNKNGMAHTAIGRGRLGLKVQHGIVPVEEDGSAYFEVPANKNIYFQALDENYMAVQTERTYVNYMPGETRSCLGCHETPKIAATFPQNGMPMALNRTVSEPQPQPGDSRAEKVIDYMTQIQPVWDQHCVSCHSAVDPKGGLNLSGEQTTMFSTSYDALMKWKKTVGGPCVGEYQSANENVGNADISYKHPYTSGSHTSPLVTVISNGRIPLRHPQAAQIVPRLIMEHKNIRLSEAEFVRVVNWIDSFSQFYPSYWGLKHKGYAGHEFYRPQVTFEEAVSWEIPVRLADLYENPPPSIKLPPKKKKK